jgi:hypothetical protein
MATAAAGTIGGVFRSRDPGGLRARGQGIDRRSLSRPPGRMDTWTNRDEVVPRGHHLANQRHPSAESCNPSPGADASRIRRNRTQNSVPPAGIEPATHGHTDGMIPNYLADALAKRLLPQLPEGVTIRASEGQVEISGMSGRWASLEVDSVLDQPGEVVQLVADAIEMVLTDVQDFVVQEIGRPWPSAAGDEAHLPLPNVVRTKQGFRMIYGRSVVPTSELEPLSLAELRLPVKRQAGGRP